MPRTSVCDELGGAEDRAVDVRLGGEVDDRVAARAGRSRPRRRRRCRRRRARTSTPVEVRRVAGVGELVEHDHARRRPRASRLTKCEPMKPAPPVTRTAHAHARAQVRRATAEIAAAGRGTRAGPSRQCGSCGASSRSLRSTEYAGRGAGRPSSAVEIGRTRQSSPASSKIASANSAQRAVAVGGDVPDARARSATSAAHRRREVADVGRGSRAGRRRRRPRRARAPSRSIVRTKLCPVGPKSHDERTIQRVLAGRALAVQLRPPVHRERVRRRPTRRTARACARRRRSRVEK